MSRVDAREHPAQTHYDYRCEDTPSTSTSLSDSRIRLIPAKSKHTYPDLTLHTIRSSSPSSIGFFPKFSTQFSQSPVYHRARMFYHRFAPSAILAVVAAVASAQTYRVHNSCPSGIELFIGGQSQGSLSRGAVIIKTDLGTSPGFWYTTANGGIVDGLLVAAKAGFYFEPNYWYYYLVRDPNSSHFNTGIRIVPSQPESGGYCRTAECSSGTCTTAYTSPPVFHGGPPPANSPPPTPPVYQCKVDPSQISFDITFCPSGEWPSETGTPVYHNFDPNKCIDVQGNVLANGTPVQIYDCNGTGAQRWVLQAGGTKLRLANTNFCLDAGSNPGNGV